MVQRLVAALSLQRPSFEPRLVFVGFVTDEVVMEQVFVRIIEFSPAIIILQSQ
jgi:hypothetical protein